MNGKIQQKSTINKSIINYIYEKIDIKSPKNQSKYTNKKTIFKNNDKSTIYQEKKNQLKM